MSICLLPWGCKGKIERIILDHSSRKLIRRMLMTDPSEDISRHFIPHHLVHDCVVLSGVSIFQLKKNHASLGIRHNSEFWSWFKKKRSILHRLTLEWFETQIWAPRWFFFLPSHPFTVPSRSVKQTRRERSSHYEIIKAISWACLLWHRSAQVYLLLKKEQWYPRWLLVPAIVNWLGPQQEHRTSLSLSTVAAAKKHLLEVLK